MGCTDPLLSVRWQATSFMLTFAKISITQLVVMTGTASLQKVGTTRLLRPKSAKTSRSSCKSSNKGYNRTLIMPDPPTNEPTPPLHSLSFLHRNAWYRFFLLLLFFFFQIFLFFCHLQFFLHLIILVYVHAHTYINHSCISNDCPSIISLHARHICMPPGNKASLTSLPLQ